MRNSGFATGSPTSRSSYPEKGLIRPAIRSQYRRRVSARMRSSVASRKNDSHSRRKRSILETLAASESRPALTRWRNAWVCTRGESRPPAGAAPSRPRCPGRGHRAASRRTSRRLSGPSPPAAGAARSPGAPRRRTPAPRPDRAGPSRTDPAAEPRHGANCPERPSPEVLDVVPLHHRSVGVREEAPVRGVSPENRAGPLAAGVAELEKGQPPVPASCPITLTVEFSPRNLSRGSDGYLATLSIMTMERSLPALPKVANCRRCRCRRRRSRSPR